MNEMPRIGAEGPLPLRALSAFLHHRSGSPFRFRSPRRGPSPPPIGCVRAPPSPTGFRWIHLDIEPTYPGDPESLALLRAIESVGHRFGSVLSVAAPAFVPAPWLHPALAHVVGSYPAWSGGYYREVSALVDPIAVMTYADGLPGGWVYGSFVRWETHSFARELPTGPVDRREPRVMG
jgi:hypothetical protein